MKRRLCRILAALMAVCLLLPVGVSAAEETGDGHILTQPELLELYEFPDNWSTDALRFCVANGIMRGRDDGLAPNANTTRAETAALLVRLLGAQNETPDLSQFSDAQEGAWYYSEMAAAVELGIMKGTGDNQLSPNAAITREQVFTLLSRAFGIYPMDTDYWQGFTDGRSCSGYARDAISALGERGILTGYTDGTVRPKKPITRAELAKLLYELFTCVCDDPAELPAAGSVLYRGSEPIPEGYTLDGSLTIGCGYSGEQTLTGLTVTDRLALRPALGTEIELSGCDIKTLSVPAAMTVSGDTAVEWVTSSGIGSVITVPAQRISVFADCTVAADVEELTCTEENTTVTLNGNAAYCLLDGRSITLNGTGNAATVDNHSIKNQIQVSYENQVDNTDDDPDKALQIVETLPVWDTVTQDTYLYARSGLYDQIRTLPAGTRLDHYYYTEGNAAAAVYTEDGAFGWVDIRCIQIPEETQIREPYCQEVMEAFVNQKGYSSATSQLIWVSLKTQTVNVFTGGSGSWKLVKSMPCSSGKNATPTARGQFAVEKHYWEWNFGSYKVRNVTTFYEGYAFHSRIYSPDYSTMLDSTIGTPVSDGCLRMLDEDCYYILTSVSTGTRVVVY